MPTASKKWLRTAQGDSFKRVGPCAILLTHRVGGGSAGIIHRRHGSGEAERYEKFRWVEAGSFRQGKRIADAALSACARGAAAQWPPKDYGTRTLAPRRGQ